MGISNRDSPAGACQIGGVSGFDIQPVRLIREHPQWVVVGKPPDLLIHPTRPDGQYTLLEYLRQAYPGEAVSIINRLDRETSGLVLAARTREAASRLGKMTMQRELRKTYLALACGSAPPAATISARLERQGKFGPTKIYLKRAILPEGCSAVTRFTRKEMRRGLDGRIYTLLEVELESGRTHQIRVHLAHAGHPVVGDKIYGPDEQNYLRFIRSGWTDELQGSLLLRRHALHASRLEFVWDGEAHLCEDALWSDLQEFWDSLAVF